MGTTSPKVTATDVDGAALRISGAVNVTPLERNPRLSRLTGLDVWLKREDLQTARSYKVRGAYNLIAQLDEGAAAAGVVCASAGNHAQGVAQACAALGVEARIFLPRTTPRQKRQRVAQIGGCWVETIIAGDYFDQAASAARDDARTRGATLVPPFDDARVIAGQGTVVREIADQLTTPPDVVVVPVGGAGLLAGTLAGSRRDIRPCASSAWSRWVQRASRLRCGPANRPRCRRSTPSSTEPRWPGSGNSPSSWCNLLQTT
jgi:threonine dehydratase